MYNKAIFCGCDGLEIEVQKHGDDQVKVSEPLFAAQKNKNIYSSIIFGRANQNEARIVSNNKLISVLAPNLKPDK